VLTTPSVIGSLKGVVDTSLDPFLRVDVRSLVVLLNKSDLTVNDLAELDNCGVDVIIEIAPFPSMLVLRF